MYVSIVTPYQHVAVIVIRDGCLPSCLLVEVYWWGGGGWLHQEKFGLISFLPREHCSELSHGGMLISSGFGSLVSLWIFGQTLNVCSVYESLVRLWMFVQSMNLWSDFECLFSLWIFGQTLKEEVRECWKRPLPDSRRNYTSLQQADAASCSTWYRRPASYICVSVSVMSEGSVSVTCFCV